MADVALNMSLVHVLFRNTAGQSACSTLNVAEKRARVVAGWTSIELSFFFFFSEVYVGLSTQYRINSISSRKVFIAGFYFAIMHLFINTIVIIFDQKFELAHNLFRCVTSTIDCLWCHFFLQIV